MVWPLAHENARSCARITLIIAWSGSTAAAAAVTMMVSNSMHTHTHSHTNQMYPHTCNCISMENDVSSMIRMKTQRKMNRKPLEQQQQLSPTLFPHHYDGLRLFINFDICDDDAPLQFQLMKSIEISFFIYNVPSAVCAVRVCMWTTLHKYAIHPFEYVVRRNILLSAIFLFISFPSFLSLRLI